MAVFYDSTRRIDTGRWVIKMEAEDYAGEVHSLQVAFKRKPNRAERDDAITLLEDKLHLAVQVANQKLQGF